MKIVQVLEPISKIADHAQGKEGHFKKKIRFKAWIENNIYKIWALIHNSRFNPTDPEQRPFIFSLGLWKPGQVISTMRDMLRIRSISGRILGLV